MFENIETKVETETITKNSLLILLTEEEVTAALVNPSKLIKRLRQERAKWHTPTAASTWSATGHAGMTPPNKRKNGKQAAEKKAGGETGLQKCPHCRQPFKRLVKHLPTCPDRPTGAAAGSEE
jgi:hypothetical protein